MSDLEILEFLESDKNETNRKRRHQRRLLREQTDPFDFEDIEFIRRYRLSKTLVRELCDDIRPMFKESSRSTDLPMETKVFVALSFYATGSYQRPVGDMSAHSLAQQTVSSAIAEVTKCINSSQMRRKYIVFPRTPENRNRTRTEFHQRFGLPGVLGCIDCTHVAIVRPTLNEERYFSRKHYHSLNVQLICDAHMQITSVDASFGGATHDCFIWAHHPIKSHLESLEESTWLLGDSGYPLRKNMMTPIVNAAPNTPESFYTDRHVRTRNIIERTIGLLKARFRCLLVHRVLHYAPEVAASIVNACVILHNICNRANLTVPELSDADAHEEARVQQDISNRVSLNNTGNNSDLQLGFLIRSNLIRRLWGEPREA